MFHLFGDYIRKSSFYLKLEDALFGKKVTWVSASTSFQKLIKRTVKEPASVTVMPFPLNLESFHFSKELRRNIRDELSLKNEDKLFLYTGRISAQKNIHLLIEEFNRWQLKNPHFHLALIGPLDHFESPTFFEKSYRPGEYYFELSTLLAKLKNKNIQFIQRLDHKKLNAYYNAADLFLSYSLYHDEDYGYSPLEALATGCPCLLTKWCGFLDTLKLAKNFSAGKNVFWENKELLIEQTSSESLHNLLEINSLSREKFAHSIHDELADEKLSQYISKIVNTSESFSGFSDILAKQALNLYSPSEQINFELYEFLYQSFWSEE